MNSDVNITVMLRLLWQRAKLDQDIHNVAKTMFVPGLNIRYRVNTRDYFGRVLAVVGLPGKTQVHVENVVTLKKRYIALSDVTGLVQEN